VLLVADDAHEFITAEHVVETDRLVNRDVLGVTVEREFLLFPNISHDLARHLGHEAVGAGKKPKGCSGHGASPVRAAKKP